MTESDFSLKPTKLRLR